MSEPAGIQWLKDCGVVHQLERILAIAAVTGDSEDNRDAADLAVILGRPDLARELIRTSRTPHGPLWTEYQRAMTALLAGSTYQAPTLKRRGLGATFLPYLRLAEVLSIVGNSERASTEVDEAFRHRNHNKTFHDSIGIHGDGIRPVSCSPRRKTSIPRTN